MDGAGLALAIWSLVGLQDPAAPAPVAPAPAAPALTPEEFARQLEADGIRFDRERKEVRVRGALLRRRPSREYPIEYALVTEGGFTHEAFGLVRCTPSLLNACFLALDLHPGLPRRRVLRNPLPSREEIESGLEDPYDVLPPSGDRVFIYVTWKGADGKEAVCPFEDLFVDLREEQRLPLRGYVYLGSRFTDVQFGAEKKRVFIADYEGNLVTLHPDKSLAENCLFDVYSFDDEPYLWSDVCVERLPPEDAQLEFLFTLTVPPGARPFEPEAPLKVIEVAPASELAARSRNPCFDGTHAEWIEKLGRRPLGELVAILKRGRTPLRETVAGLLGATGRDDVVEPLALSLKFDRSPEVRLASASALAELGIPSATAALCRALQSPSLAIRDDALFALRLLSGEDFGRDAAAWKAWFDAHPAERR